MKWKLASTLSITSVIALSGLASQVSAAEATETTTVIEDVEEITEAAEQGDVSKEQLIDRIKEMFPDKFAEGSDEDFHMEFYSHYPEEENTEFYNIYYSKDSMNANFEFTSEDLELSHFSFHSQENSDALYPPEVSKEEAREIAVEFINELGYGSDYELNESAADRYYYGTNRPLTEPVEYSFTFNRLENDIPVTDKSIYLSVYGNGEISQFSSSNPHESAQYESTNNILDKNTLLNKLKDELNIELQYIVLPDYTTGNSSKAYLTYREVPTVDGISAKDGKYYINGEYADEITDSGQQVKMLTGSSKEAAPITKEEARQLVEGIMEPTVDGKTLHIEQVYERVYPDGTEVFDVNYMYMDDNGGFGSAVSVSKNTGELLDFYGEAGTNGSEQAETEISKEDALEKAVEYIQEYAYVNMEEYAYPVTSNDMYRSYNDNYSFNFPRVKNGIIVEGDSIRVRVSNSDGSLLSLSKDRSNITEWPAADQAVNEADALESIKDKIDLELYYINENSDSMKEESQTLQYKLSYLRADSDNPLFFNAVTGEWETYAPYIESPDGTNQDIHVNHQWAEDELNFLINNNIISVEDLNNFDGDAVVTKGEALEILIKSITHVYEDPYFEEQPDSPFTNIEKSHPLYPVIIQAVEMGILDTESSTFDVDEPIKTEELSAWYIHTLGLEYVAQQHDTFQYDFEGADDISDEYRGYVALANSFGLLEYNDGNYFNAQDEVTYAQLATENIKLVKLISSEKFEVYY
ncbi:hypothetical protein F9U64_07665 [Gracilibacillus oryzae]|uniref:S-layer homology domain-containing protein n=1 Tax=Gracilibacillus oryzae TaxID=1672701 RepID=A0A7C8GTW5_9BACI|nr:PepSY1/2 domain-containing protein [Gracilibacillus oryzae]KAB8137805.1 hypothetical protein F9U64_07665 [Gracilibacillus oryzae]